MNHSPVSVLFVPFGLCVLLAGGCKTVDSEVVQEVLLETGIADGAAPEWVRGKIISEAGSVAFVGRGGGFDVLDERHAYDEALGHARAQLAQYVATLVTAEACMRDISTGVRYLPRDMWEVGQPERADQAIRSRAHEISSVLVGGAAVSDQYWERWDVNNQTHSRNGIRRYKCWVLCQVDESTVERYVASALRALENEAAVAEAESVAKDAESHAAEAQRDFDAHGAVRDAAVEAAANDIAHAQGVLNATAFELQRLRERVHYGRRFRLSGIEDCLHFRAACDFDHLHPEWRSAAVLTRTEVLPVPFPVEVPVEVKVVVVPDDDCSFCGSVGGCGHGS